MSVFEGREFTPYFLAETKKNVVEDKKEKAAREIRDAKPEGKEVRPKDADKKKRERPRRKDYEKKTLVKGIFYEALITKRNFTQFTPLCRGRHHPSRSRSSHFKAKFQGFRATSVRTGFCETARCQTG